MPVDAPIISPVEVLQLLSKKLSKNMRGALIHINMTGLQNMGTLYGTRNAETIIVDIHHVFQQALRPDDLLLRSGRFEFIALLPDIMNRGHAVLATNKLANILSRPINIGLKERKLPFSIGLALSPEHSADPEQLLRFAELASIAANISHTPYQLYASDDIAHIVTDWDIEGDLYRAISANELSLHYQPKLSTTTGKIVGAEALMRWSHPDHGMIPPDKFIPVAEQSGLMPKLTWWCLNTALRERIKWGGNRGELSVAINVSALDLEDEGFVKSITSALGIWNTKPELLTLEVTEGALMQNIALSAKVLKLIRSQGIRISIDDFGTGYSSLAYFKHLPADELKIDRSFTLNILNDELDQHIVSTIIQMAKKLNLDIVAEGIETEPMLQTLIELGADLLQGYHIARPMPQQHFIEWISE
jgi:EAL domain-containing protein (putative c-di-GMP-specific phosphodiesterase class I)/GGDEF domain-containing protein